MQKIAVDQQRNKPLPHKKSNSSLRSTKKLMIRARGLGLGQEGDRSAADEGAAAAIIHMTRTKMTPSSKASTKKLTKRLGIQDIHIKMPLPISSTKGLCPHEYLMSIWQNLHKIDVNNDIPPPNVQPSLTTTGFFHKYTKQEKESYSNNVTKAVRADDIATLRTLHRDGKCKSFQCSNLYGESLLHMACRRGSLSMIKFFLEESNVTLQCCDDFGRTPLHDACWNASPNFDLIHYIIGICPQLLWMSDRRGHAPLHYTRREHREKWVEFLDSRKDLIIHGMINNGTDGATK